MLIGDRLRAHREAMELSQNEIEKRSGLNRSYVSRIENGHIVPSVETLEKLARALEVLPYQLFYERQDPPQPPRLPKRTSRQQVDLRSSEKEARLLTKFRRLFARMADSDRRLLLYMAQKLAER